MDKPKTVKVGLTAATKQTLLPLYKPAREDRPRRPPADKANSEKTIGTKMSYRAELR